MGLLIKELQKHFELEIFEPMERTDGMSVNAILYSIEFYNYLNGKDFDAIIIRGDRYEMLGLCKIALYKGFKIIHIEGGDESGVVDNKVRHAITHLSDYHFCTNEESHKRLINMGVSPNKVWNFGSLDVEFASKVKRQKRKKEPYILVAYHGIEEEDPNELDKALEVFKDNVIIKIGGNKDYNKKYGSEEYSPEDYINLLRYAKVCVGNSSSLLKEASILGTPVVLIGDRQNKRLKPSNVMSVPCETDKIISGILYQWKYKFPPDLTYYKKNTSAKICKQLLKEVS